MKIKLLLSLFITLGLITHNKSHAMSPHAIFAISEAINLGASSGDAISNAAMTAAIVPSLMRISIAEVAILAISLRTHRNTRLILKKLNALSTMAKEEFTAVKTKLELMHADHFEESLRSAASHKLTQESIANFRGHVGLEFEKLNQKIDLNAIRAVQELADLKALMDADRATATERHKYYELQFKKVLTELEALKAGQKTGFSRITDALKFK
jgi:hypothetical protein